MGESLDGKCNVYKSKTITRKKMNEIYDTIAGVTIYQAYDGSYFWVSGMEVDADGSPNCYNPENTGLDYLANAKDEHGKWVGIVTDKNGYPVINSATGNYISTTSLQISGYRVEDQIRYINSETVAYIVIPLGLAEKIKGICLGCKCLVTNSLHNITVTAVCADIGGSSSIGEGSIYLAKQLGINSNPKNGGTSMSIIKFQIFPNTPANGFHLQPLHKT